MDKIPRGFAAACRRMRACTMSGLWTSYIESYRQTMAPFRVS